MTICRNTIFRAVLFIVLAVVACAAQNECSVAGLTSINGMQVRDAAGVLHDYACTNGTNITFLGNVGVQGIGGVNLLGQTASLGSQTLVAALPVAGRYKVHYFADQRTLCATGQNTVAFTFTWKSRSNQTRTATSVTLTLGSAQTPATSLQGTIPISGFATSPVTMTSTVTGTCTTGGPSAYDIDAWVERAQ